MPGHPTATTHLPRRQLIFSTPSKFNMGNARAGARPWLGSNGAHGEPAKGWAYGPSSR
jgi:hypothetical protein